MLNRTLPALAVTLLCFAESASATQSCRTDHMPETTPITQYVVHGDETVTDVTTGLMWMQCPQGRSDFDCSAGEVSLLAWDEALQLAQNINNSGGFAGHVDWRVPSVAELLSIVEEQCTQPAINAAVFPQTDTLFFWTGSPNIKNDDASWFVDFKFGDSGNVSRTGRYPVRLVRSIQ